MKNPCFSNEHTVFSNGLALKLGIAEAVILTRIHYLIDQCGHYIGGKKWVHITVEDWQKQLPYFTLSQIRRALIHLRKDSFLIAQKLNKDKRDHKLSYTINYPALQKLNIELSDCSFVYLPGQRRNK